MRTHTTLQKFILFINLALCSSFIFGQTTAYNPQLDKFLDTHSQVINNILKVEDEAIRKAALGYLMEFRNTEIVNFPNKNSSTVDYDHDFAEWINNYPQEADSYIKQLNKINSAVRSYHFNKQLSPSQISNIPKYTKLYDENSVCDNGKSAIYFGDICHDYLGTINHISSAENSRTCNIQASICEPGTAGPFVFNNSTPNVDFYQGCLNSPTQGANQYGYILLNITQAGPLNILINGSASSGYIDVSVFIIPEGDDPCVAIQNGSNMLSCNYASNSGGCAQFGNAFGCNSSVTAPNVNVGDQIMIIAQDWDNASSSFSLQLGPSPGAQTGPFDGTIDPAGPFCSNQPPQQLTAVTGGGTWSGTGVDANGVFDPSVGPGSYTINHTVGFAPCDGSDQITIDVFDPPTVNADNNGSYCQGETIELIGNSSETGPGVVFSWTGPGGYSSNDQNPTNATQGGTYTFTVTAGQCAPVVATTTVVIDPQADASFSYSNNTYCITDPNDPSPTITGDLGGTFTIDPATGVIDPTTGEIDINASGLGDYVVTYTHAGTCGSEGSQNLTITDAPNAEFSYSQMSYCQNEANPDIILVPGASPGVFSATPTGLSINPSTGTINLSASQPGTYTVTNFIAASAGCTEEQHDTQVEIIENDDPSFSYSGNDFCEGLTYVAPTSITTPGGTFSESTGDLDIDPNTGIINPSNSQPGTYTISYETNEDCPEIGSFTITISPNTSVTISNPPAVICEYDNPITLAGFPVNGVFSGTGITDNGDGTASFDPSIGEGVHDVTYELEDSCYNSLTIQVTVQTTNTTILSSEDGLDFCIGHEPILIESSNTSGSWSPSAPWVFNNGDGTVYFIPDSSGVGTFTISFTPTGFCYETATIDINIYDYPDAPFVANQDYCLGSDALLLTDPNTTGTLNWYDEVGNFIESSSIFSPEINDSGIYTFCVSETVNGCESDLHCFEIDANSPTPTFTMNSDTLCIGDELPIYSVPSSGTINWYDSEGNLLETSETYTPEIDDLGIYEFCVSETIDGCESDLYCFELFVGNPQANFTVDPESGDMPLDITTTNNSSNATNFYWDFGNDDESFDFQPDYTYEDWGDFELILIASDEYGCEDEYSITISVNAPSSIEIPNVFTPNGDGVNDVFRIIGDHLESLEGRIFNRWGQLVYDWNGYRGGWDGRTNSGVEASEGVYYYKITAKGIDGKNYEFIGNVTLVR
jgi:trimeric autotransporter adhesin